MKQNTFEVIKQGRRVGVPLFAVETADQPGYVARLVSNVGEGSPRVRWDIAEGFKPLDKESAKALDEAMESFATVQPEGQPPMTLDDARGNPVVALDIMAHLPDSSLVVVLNAQRILDGKSAPIVCQQILNLRDEFKAIACTLVLLGPALDMPADLRHDVIVLEDPRPNDSELGAVVSRVFKGAKEAAPSIVEPTDEEVARIVTAGRGLSEFEAEQIYSLSMSRSGLDLDSAWQRKIAQLNKLSGVTFSRGGLTLDDVGGLEAFIKFMAGLTAWGPELVLFMDEIEKAVAGATGDSGGESTGTAKDIMGQLLTTSEEHQWEGVLLFGPPGVGKSLIAAILAQIYNALLCRFDIGDLYDKYLGQTQHAIRDRLAIINGITPKVLMVATCNNDRALPPELKSRFASGEWFVDLPDDGEKESIWKIHRAAFDIDSSDETPDDGGWSGREIRNCCRNASRRRWTLADAAQFIVPVAKSEADTIEKLRATAARRGFLDASRGGAYERGRSTKPKAKGGRKLTL